MTFAQTVLQNTVTVNLSMSMRYVAQAIGAFLLLIIISWKLTLVMMSCIPVVAIGTRSILSVKCS